MTAGRQRYRLVEKIARVADNLLPPDRVVLCSLLTSIDLENDIGTVERIVEAVPARVGGVECITRIVDWHHQLGAGDYRNLVIDIVGSHLEGIRLGNQVTDLLQKSFVLIELNGGRIGLMPVIYLGL